MVEDKKIKVQKSPEDIEKEDVDKRIVQNIDIHKKTFLDIFMKNLEKKRKKLAGNQNIKSSDTMSSSGSAKSSDATASPVVGGPVTETINKTLLKRIDIKYTAISDDFEKFINDFKKLDKFKAKDFEDMWIRFESKYNDFLNTL